MRDRWINKQILKRPDVTNYQKAAEDALQGILFVSDAQVMSIRAHKSYMVCEHGMTIIILREFRKDIVLRDVEVGIVAN